MGNTIDPSHLLVHQGSDKPNVEKKGDSEIMEHKELECQSDSQFWDSKHRRQLVFFFPGHGDVCDKFGGPLLQVVQSSSNHG